MAARGGSTRLARMRRFTSAPTTQYSTPLPRLWAGLRPATHLLTLESPHGRYSLAHQTPFLQACHQNQKTWMKRYKLPDHNYDQWASFLANQWHLHSNHLASTTARSSQEVGQLCTTTSHLVRLPADHHSHRVHLACPLHFFTLLDRTFANGTVLSVCHPQPLDELLSELKRAVPTTLRKTYAWGTHHPLRLYCGKLLGPSSATATLGALQ